MEESPLHPFELHNFIQINLGGLDISINKAVIMMWVVVGLISILMIMAGSARRLVPGKLQSLAEMRSTSSAASFSTRWEKTG